MIRRLARSPHAAILILLVLSPVLGLFLADDYGQTWDDIIEDKAGARALAAYLPGSLLRDHDEDYVHATFYFMLNSGVSRFLSTMPLGLDRSEIRHYLNYLTLLLAIAAGYYLAARLFGRRAASITALLMLAQPLFFGHAFINLKDIPFAAFFTASIALGVYATSAIEARAREPSGEWQRPVSRPSTLARMGADWRHASTNQRLVILTIGVLGGMLIADLFLQRIILPSLQSILSQAYAGQAGRMIDQLFQTLAEDAYKTPLEAYELKLRSVYLLLRAMLVPLTLATLLWAWRRMIGPIHLRIPLIQDPAQRRLLLAGIAMGLTSAVRPIGLFAGLLTALYMLLRLRRRALPLLAFFGLTAAIVTYLSWPALWGDPLGEFWSRLTGSIRFSRSHEVLFQGKVISSSSLPALYLPTLLAIQFTEPVLLFVPLGLSVALRSAWRAESDRALAVVLALWFGLPFLTQIGLRGSLHGNMRHMLFMTVPLLMLAGLGAQVAIGRLRTRWIQRLAILLALVPGIYEIVRFHPYEYIYYNQLVGGAQGAEGRYELDYWCSSYRDLMGWLNLHSPENAQIAAWGPVDMAAGFARPDLTVERWVPGSGDSDFRMACGRGLLEQGLFDRTQTEFEVRRAGVLLGKLASVEQGD